MYLVVCFDESYMLPFIFLCSLILISESFRLSQSEGKEYKNTEHKSPFHEFYLDTQFYSFSTCICPEATVSASRRGSDSLLS